MPSWSLRTRFEYALRPGRRTAALRSGQLPPLASGRGGTAPLSWDRCVRCSLGILCRGDSTHTTRRRCFCVQKFSRFLASSASLFQILTQGPRHQLREGEPFINSSMLNRGPKRLRQTHGCSSNSLTLLFCFHFVPPVELQE